MRRANWRGPQLVRNTFRFGWRARRITRALIAKLIQAIVSTVNEHLERILTEREVRAGATIRKFRIVHREGSGRSSREIEQYSLLAILATGYRVRSLRGMQFRK